MIQKTVFRVNLLQGMTVVIICQRKIVVLLAQAVSYITIQKRFLITKKQNFWSIIKLFQNVDFTLLFKIFDRFQFLTNSKKSKLLKLLKYQTCYLR